MNLVENEKSVEFDTVFIEHKNKCIQYSLYHTKDCQRNTDWNTTLNVINIVITSLSSITITGVTSIKNINSSSLDILNSVFAVVLVFSAIVNSVQQWAKYEKQAELHRITSEKYASLANNINSHVILSKLENIKNSERLAFLKSITKELNNILAHSPSISRTTFEKHSVCNVTHQLQTQQQGQTNNVVETNIQTNNVVETNTQTNNVVETSSSEEEPKESKEEQVIVIDKIKLSNQKRSDYELQRFFNNTYDN